MNYAKPILKDIQRKNIVTCVQLHASFVKMDLAISNLLHKFAIRNCQNSNLKIKKYIHNLIFFTFKNVYYVISYSFVTFHSSK